MFETSVSDNGAIIGWMAAHIATLTGRQSEEIAPSELLSAFDLDSVDAVEMALRFEERFGFAINPETFLVGQVSLAEIARQLDPNLSSDRPTGS